ncbi:GNAT family N-acetyltransferase [Beduini massiliensis]|uniref:GNAT family N-acetyltransferase n=1 Tax=Beduini massiliensis TaxID=1585974 RepID=UPI00059A7A32|nr:GNAT family N-acetyltransferase [Beduini massiliensis]
MLLKFENLKIRNAVAEDAKLLATWWNDGMIMAHAGFPNGIGQSVDEIRTSLNNAADKSYQQFIIEMSRIPIGEMSYRHIGEEIAEISIKICNFSLHNKGLGKKLLSMLISSLFNDLKYKIIILNTNLKNKRAQHVYEELGFKQVQVLKNSWQNQLGESQSTVEYALQKEDFVDFTK